jgi:hypothetical protein
MAGLTPTGSGRTPNPVRRTAAREREPETRVEELGETTNRPAPRVLAAARESLAMLIGMLVVVAGFVAILVGLWIVVINFHTAADATATFGIVTTAIAGFGGAFFGFAMGQQGTASANKERAAAEAAKDEAQMMSIRFAANMDPEIARRLVE